MTLQRLDSRAIPDVSGECRAFLVCRDEAARLPYTLEYHRKLGVDRFLLIDNGSDDSSVEFLLQQPDCHVFRTEDSYARSGYGVVWINLLLNDYGCNGWNLILDADELFTYPHSETLSLPALCAYLDQQGKQGLLTFMLDMYSASPISQTHYVPGTPFLETCRWFDTEYQFRTRVPLLRLQWPFPGLEVIGGPRQRYFYSHFANRGRFAYELGKAMKRLRQSHLGQTLGIKRYNWNDAVPPMLTKIPLTKGSAGIRYVNAHKSESLLLARETGILLHFKYFSDFHQRVEDAIASGEHFDDSSEYARYRTALLENPKLSFHYEGSARYNGSGQLLELGLMNSSPELDAIGETNDLARTANCSH